MWGQPVVVGDHPTPTNLSPPELANAQAMASWSSARTLAQNDPVASMRGQLTEVLAGAMAISGGSRESEKNDWQVKPSGPSGSMPVTTVTPLAKWPRTARNSAFSIGVGSTGTPESLVRRGALPRR
jgi:hypothetical protein